MWSTTKVFDILGLYILIYDSMFYLDWKGSKKINKKSEKLNCLNWKKKKIISWLDWYKLYIYIYIYIYINEFIK